MAGTAADKAALAQAQALLAKQKAQLAALEKSQADAAAFAAADAKQTKADATAQKLADMKAAREADLAAKSQARVDARGATGGTGQTNTVDPATLAVQGSNIFQMLGGILYFNGSPFSGNQGDTTYVNGVVSQTAANAKKDTAATDAETAAKKAANQANVSTAIEDFRANLKLAGLDSLVDVIDGYIKQDMTAAQIKINLVGTDAYKARFPAMATLAGKGRAVNEATYISMERGYEQVLRAYGVDQATFGSRTELGKYIGAEVSPVEFEQRVQIAKDRVDKNTDVTAALQDYYGVSKGGAIAFLLNPELGMDIVKKEARAAEIGAAAIAAGFGEFAGKANVGVAESFVNASGTQDLVSLKSEFGKARNLANVQGSLAAIEGDKTYKDLNAVTAVVGQDTAELLQSQRRAAREAARFGGSSGLSAQSLRANQAGI